MIEELINEIEKYDYLDAIVVEGYDGVGKGAILNALSEYYKVVPYRPDYNLWQKFDHRKSDRWKVSGFFWDVFSHFNITSTEVLLFDRGVLSGAVYNDDMTIAYHYKEMLRDMKVLHILVTCSAEAYYKFYRSRNPEASDGFITDEWEKCLEYTDRYLEALESAEVEYITYMNQYDDKISQDVCSSCGHYSYGLCRHPKKNCKVDGSQSRCELANEREVQDIDSEMYSMQS